MSVIKEVAAGYAGGGLREALSGAANKLNGVTEIRARLDKPLLIRAAGVDYFIQADGSITEDLKKAYKPSGRDISLSLELLSDYSMYAFQEELRNGFITIPGGHRVGLAGRFAVDTGEVTALKSVTGLCYRIAGEVIGCADPLLEHIVYEDRCRHVMIISPPGRGKTTLLRDIIRLLSQYGFNVGAADERGELAGSRNGTPSMDLGPRADVLDGCPKVHGMQMLLRSMSPDVIAVDEIGPGEAGAARDILNAGVGLICTAHGTGINDVMPREILDAILSFKPEGRAVVLGRDRHPGAVIGVYDGRGKNLL